MTLGVNKQGRAAMDRVHGKGAAAAPPAENGLAAFANSPLGQTYAQGMNMFGQHEMPDYTGAFQGALDAARGNIAQGLHGALSDIANSQARAGEALKQYAPMVNNNWQENQKTNQAALGSIAGANDAAGVGQINNGVLGGGRLQGDTGAMLRGEMAPEMAAASAAHRSDLSDQALLNTGMQQQAEHENALAQLAAQQAQGGLDAQAMGFQQSMALQGMQNQSAQELAKQQFGYGLLTNAQNNTAQANLYKQQKTDAADTAPATGQYKDTGLYKTQVDNIHKTPKYERIAAYINSHKDDPAALSAILVGLPTEWQRVLGVDFNAELQGLSGAPLELPGMPNPSVSGPYGNSVANSLYRYSVPNIAKNALSLIPGTR
jgi:hypothetical protein